MLGQNEACGTQRRRGRSGRCRIVVGREKGQGDSWEWGLQSRLFESLSQGSYTEAHPGPSRVQSLKLQSQPMFVLAPLRERDGSSLGFHGLPWVRLVRQVIAAPSSSAVPAAGASLALAVRALPGPLACVEPDQGADTWDLQDDSCSDPEGDDEEAPVASPSLVCIICKAKPGEARSLFPHHQCKARLGTERLCSHCISPGCVCKCVSVALPQSALARVHALGKGAPVIHHVLVSPCIRQVAFPSVFALRFPRRVDSA